MNYLDSDVLLLKSTLKQIGFKDPKIEEDIFEYNEIYLTENGAIRLFFDTLEKHLNVLLIKLTDGQLPHKHDKEFSVLINFYIDAIDPKIDITKTAIKEDSGSLYIAELCGVLNNKKEEFLNIKTSAFNKARNLRDDYFKNL